MEHILKFILENYSRFTLFDIVTLVIFAVLAILGAFAFFKIVYTTVVSAQKNAIEAKDQHIATLKDQYLLLEKERDRLEDQSSQLWQTLQHMSFEYHKASSDAKMTKEILMEYAVPNLVSSRFLLLQAKILFGTLRLLKICLVELIIYMELRAHEKYTHAPLPWELYSSLAKTSDQLDRFWRLISATGNEALPKGQIVLSADILKLDTSVVEKQISEVHKRIAMVLSKDIAKEPK